MALAAPSWGIPGTAAPWWVKGSSSVRSDSILRTRLQASRCRCRCRTRRASSPSPPLSTRWHCHCVCVCVCVLFCVCVLLCVCARARETNSVFWDVAQTQGQIPHSSPCWCVLDVGCMNVYLISSLRSLTLEADVGDGSQGRISDEGACPTSQRCALALDREIPRGAWRRLQ